ncbi:hypothetical protein Plhal304r1_c024g0081701 [Plasmopara halstedii]
MEEIGLFSQDFLAVGGSARTIPSEAQIMPIRENDVKWHRFRVQTSKYLHVRKKSWA